jgi:hypothetical protein
LLYVTEFSCSFPLLRHLSKKKKMDVWISENEIYLRARVQGEEEVKAENALGLSAEQGYGSSETCSALEPRRSPS